MQSLPITINILRKWGALDTTLCDEVCQWLVARRLFSHGTPVSPKQWNWPPRYSWNIVESSVKHHNPNPNICVDTLHIYFCICIYLRRKMYSSCSRSFNVECCMNYLKIDRLYIIIVIWVKQLKLSDTYMYNVYIYQ